MDEKNLAAAFGIILVSGLAVVQYMPPESGRSSRCVLNSSGFEGSPLMLKSLERSNGSIELTFENGGLSPVYLKNSSLINGENITTHQVNRSIGLSDNVSISFNISEGSGCENIEGSLYYDVSKAGLENRNLNGSLKGRFSLR